MASIAPTTDIVANLRELEEHINAACRRAGRKRAEVTLVAVSKTRSIAEIDCAYHGGVRDFGENRVEEAETKIPLLRQKYAAAPITWHLVGHVQSRKARQAVELADVIHSVDSIKLAMRLDRFAEEMGKRVPVLLEVNVSGEVTKHGFPACEPALRDAFVEQARLLAELRHLDVRGLMTMAPIVTDASQARPVFRALRELRDLLRTQAPFSTWTELSMGMTDDYQIAIEEGATIVRLGRAIFGPSAY